ncbi:ScbR family autoregulator-binding transcription factor [Streptomyces sp. ISL-11]|uniref:ScbR family autoregulator-binding transcription factor n=1 Tax=Streptomyces sp. ISL-11 TaxID=2819174 RepID=UPI001BE811BE|nr:ScbR family autoregulator-binding transcription factor [Streptomyces sp. ISL-11]MBT2386618.1 helix-turn-helix transcriptional regulator [Streptomyces sp. ISL-11]
MTKQERAINTRQALIRSAAHTFDQHGYTRAKLATISQHAGVSSGALHFHFDTKAAIAHAVETHATQTLHHLTHTPHPHTNPLHTLIHTTHLIAHQLTHDTITRAGYHLNTHQPHTHPTHTPHHPNLHTQWTHYIHHHIHQAHQQNLLPPHTNPHHLTTTITAATTGLTTLHQHNPTYLNPTTITHLFHTLLPHTHHQHNNHHEQTHTQ